MPVNRPGFCGDSTSMRKDGVHGTTEKISSRVSGEGADESDEKLA